MHRRSQFIEKNSDTASKAFKLFRQLENTHAGLILKGKISPDAYGSDNLIIDLFDFVETEYDGDFDKAYNFWVQKLQDQFEESQNNFKYGHTGKGMKKFDWRGGDLYGSFTQHKPKGSRQNSCSKRAELESNSYKKEWIGYKNFDHAFDYAHYDDFMEEVFADLRELESRHYPIFVPHKKVKLYNIPASFDIETTSFYDAARGKKHATMYIWQFGFNGSVIYGRTWDEFFDFIEKFTNELGCNESCIIYIYVHNLSYEFQWIRRYFEWNKVFALKKRKVLYASYLPLGIQFCCSYILTNASLAHVGDPENGMLTRYKVSKLVGKLDYSKMRHSGTPLTANELAYCLNDVRVVMALIQEKIEHDGGINNIPLTNTGYVRRYCRK